METWYSFFVCSLSKKKKPLRPGNVVQENPRLASEHAPTSFTNQREDLMFIVACAHAKAVGGVPCPPDQNQWYQYRGAFSSLSPQLHLVLAGERP